MLLFHRMEDKNRKVDLSLPRVLNVSVTFSLSMPRSVKGQSGRFRKLVDLCLPAPCCWRQVPCTENGDIPPHHLARHALRRVLIDGYICGQVFSLLAHPVSYTHLRAHETRHDL